MTKSAAGCKELCCSKRLRAGACFLEQPWAKTRHNIFKEKTGFRQTEIAMIKFKRAGLACVLLIASSLAQGPTTFHPGFNFFSRQQDVQLGQESAAQVRRQMQIVKDPFLNDYVNRVGRKLANTPEARASGFPFTFEVVADPSINAFALRGGPRFINTGCLKAAEYEAELAGVMGHDMSQVLLRRGAAQASQGGSRGLQFFSDHPNPGNRERAIEEEADKLPRRNYGYETGEFGRMKQVVSGVHEPPPRRQVGR